MARRKQNTPPAYRLHKPSGQARVRSDGHDLYLGKHGSPESIAAYQRLVNAWLKNGRRLPENIREVIGGNALLAGPAALPAQITVVELVDQYREWSLAEYGDTGTSCEHRNTMDAVAPVVRLFGRLPASVFGPNALREVRQTMVEGRHRVPEEGEPKPEPLSRKTINDRVHRIRRVFRWGVSRELIPSSVVAALDTVDAIRSGRGQAKETAKVKPVSDEVVNATLPHLPKPIDDVVRLQRLTGMRPGELLMVRGCDIDTTGETWEYRPARHKTQGLGHDRVVYLGPQAKEIIRQYLTADTTAYLFNPSRTRDDRYAKMRAARKTKVQPSQINRKSHKPKRAPGVKYRVGSYANAIRRACEKYGIEHWHPHQIRHTIATRLRREHGVDMSRVILGHSSLDATEIYAEADRERASQIMRKIG